MTRWNMQVTRLGIQQAGLGNAGETMYGATRTLSQFDVSLDGAVIIQGYLCESTGPSTSEAAAGRNPWRRILPGIYPVWTHYTDEYKSVDYAAVGSEPRPAFGVDGAPEPEGCGREGILIHPGHASALYLSSIGCLNPVSQRLAADQNMDPNDSWDLVVQIIDSLKAFVPAAFGNATDTRIADATITVIGDTMDVID